MDPKTDCANYLNQPAIDKAIRDANRRMMENFYEEGTCYCLTCDIDPVILQMELMIGREVHRICYQPVKERV